jgi:hypothetical protein
VTPDQKRLYLLFMTQMTLSFLAYSMVAAWYAGPHLAALAPVQAYTMLMIPHTLRHLGMTILSRTVVDENIPKTASYPIAFGDLASTLLAMGALGALHAGSGLAIPLVWATTIVGAADLVNAFVVGTKVMLVKYTLGSFWYVPTFVVPFLFVNHVVTFWLLLR